MSAQDSLKTSRPIQKGDHVFIGNGAVHWVVEDAHYRTAFPVADLVSPMSGVRRLVQISKLRLHSTAAEVLERSKVGATQRAAAERAAENMLRGEMVAEGVVTQERGALVLKVGERNFMVEVRAFLVDPETPISETGEH